VSGYASSAAAAVGDMKNRATDAASSYASSIAEYADSTRRSVYEGSARLTNQAQSALQVATEGVRDQPLLVAALGLAAGAAVAAVFPASELERRTLGEARDVIAEAATRAGENLVGAAGEAGEKLKAGVTERGLDLAREVADTFATAATGKTEERPSSRPSDATPRGNV
jgi:hypothetical protein